MSKVENLVKTQLRTWALKKDICFDERGYVCNINHNLFEPLSDKARSQFESGDGQELGQRMKMNALHSSSALACNFFHHFQKIGLGILEEVFGLDKGYSDLTFEKKYSKPNQIGGNPPNVDIELSGQIVKPVAIESKFLEPYNPKEQDLKRAYIDHPEIWKGCKKCFELANEIYEKPDKFTCLNAAQLLKHIVGLLNTYPDGSFRVVYLWYKIDSEEAVEHEKQVEVFKNFVDDNIDFQADTYQEAFIRLKNNCSGHSPFLKYLEERYFS